MKGTCKGESGEPQASDTVRQQGKELAVLGSHWEQGGANEADGGQVCRNKSSAEKEST